MNKELKEKKEKLWADVFASILKSKWDHACNTLLSLQKIDANDHQVFLKLGDVYQKLNKQPEAITAYHKSAGILEVNGFGNKAIALCKMILRLDAQNSQANDLMNKLLASKAEQGRLAGFSEEKFTVKVTPSDVEEMPAPAEMSVEQPVSWETVSPPPVEITEPAPQEMFELPETPSGWDTASPAVAESKETPEQGKSYTEVVMDWETSDLAAETSGAVQSPEFSPFQNISLLSELTTEELVDLYNMAKKLAIPAGKVVVMEGDLSDSLFIIESGTLKVVTKIRDKEIELAGLSDGDVFGEIAFLTGKPRTASVITTSSSVVFEVNRGILEELLIKYPRINLVLKTLQQIRTLETLEKIKINL